jgi:hypothetical protein
MATLYGGPAAGLAIPDETPDITWVAVANDPNGTPIPETVDGHARTLPEDANPVAEMALGHPRRRWECYRRVGTNLTELGIDPRDDLPIPTEPHAYRWVCRRNQP